MHAITLVNSNSYSFTLPHDGVATVSGVLVSTVVASAWSASYNTYTVDSSPKGNNATISVSGIGIGAIKTNFNYSQGVTIEYVDPANLVYSHTDSPYFEDIYYKLKINKILDNPIYYKKVLDNCY